MELAVDRAGLLAALDRVIERCVSYYLHCQQPAGYWVGELESNASITAEYLFLRRLLHRADPAREHDLAREIAAQLLDWQVDGGWPLYHGGPPELNCTIEAAVALQLAGLPTTDPALVRAAEAVRALGGLERARVFTRLWLALLQAMPWSAVPDMPVELMLLPAAFPFSIYRFASWARSSIVPLLVLMDRPPAYDGPVPDIRQFWASERRFLGRPGRSQLGASIAGFACDLLRRTGSAGWRKELHRRALSLAESWILAHQEADGGWAGIFPAMANSTLALATLGGHEREVEQGLAAIESFGISEGGRLRMQSCVSPGWDTPWVTLALSEAGTPPSHPALRKAATWLLGQQSHVLSDWCLQAPGVEAGGWPFEFANSRYPDTDDTALVLRALARTDVPCEPARRAGLGWLLGMQNPDGGWAAFDRKNDSRLVERIPFCDFGEVLDPSSADVTAHVLELLGELGYRPEDAAVRRGLAYLWREQEGDGSWYGRWGVNYIYGTAAVLQALAALGFGRKYGRVAMAAAWLRAHQNPDGGWGESCRSYEAREWRGRGPSTASQTAWAMLGLLALDGQDEAAWRGARWLVEHQRPDGTWEEPEFTGTGFPRDFFIKYHEYRNYFPLLALARLRGRGVVRGA